MKQSILRHALDLGFSSCGFAAAAPLDDLRDFYDHFLDEKRQATMAYLERYRDQRLDPALLLPGAKTVIAVLENYYPPAMQEESDNFIFSRYAYGKRYPPYIKKKLDILADEIRGLSNGVQTRVFVDSGPVLEKAWAQRAGIGWVGKHTILVNPRGGSFFYVGIILTTLEIEPDPPETDHCGNCRRCVDACPTGALDREYQLNIKDCITYCTSVRNAEMSGHVAKNLRGRVYGCDICQDACPFNRFATPTPDPHYHASPGFLAMKRADWLSLSPEKFEELFKGGSVEESGYERLMRNIGIVDGG
jgi:epoxyqueuosine reductase